MEENVTQLFFELIRVTLGNNTGFSKLPSSEEWVLIFDLANKQALTSVLFEGVNKLQPAPKEMIRRLRIEWIGNNQLTVSINQLHRKRAQDICQLFNTGGFRCCILKGQGTALYYKYPEYRQCGDIDLWVEGDRESILCYLRQKRYKIGHIDFKHSDVEVFEDVPVEVHFLPSWMYNPFTNKRLQSFFHKKSKDQFSNFDQLVGFTHTSIDFDLVYSMVHIFRHFFSEGVGLRQLMDYYYILQHSVVDERIDAFAILSELRLKHFVGGIMWILCNRFGMKESVALCPENERHGVFLLSEIMLSGNFGQYDNRIKRVSKTKKFQRGFFQYIRNLRFVSYYPLEVFWSPFWKLWHWIWRKRKGYL